MKGEPTPVDTMTEQDNLFHHQTQSQNLELDPFIILLPCLPYTFASVNLSERSCSLSLLLSNLCYNSRLAFKNVWRRKTQTNDGRVILEPGTARLQTLLGVAWHWAEQLFALTSDASVKCWRTTWIWTLSLEVCSLEDLTHHAQMCTFFRNEYII